MFSDFNKEKFLLIGNLTPHLIHDIRNSLSVLKLNYYYLNLKEESIPKEISSSLRDCSEAISRLEKKLDYFSLLTTNNESSIEMCSLNTLATAAIDLLKGKAKKNNVSLEDISTINIPTLKINKSKISMAVISIINSLIDTGISNQKIVLNVFANNSHQLSLEIEKLENDGKEEQNLIQENIDIFFQYIEKLKENLKGVGTGISFVGDIIGNCKIIFSFNKQ
jgi:signal transduction histidine kinase